MPRYKAYSLRNAKQLPQLQRLPPENLRAIEVVGRVLPFRANNYVVDELIDWEQAPNDPIFRLIFPQPGMLAPRHYQRIDELLASEAGRNEMQEAACDIRLQLNPHPAGQLEHNVPTIDGQKLLGIQHKYRETVLFFPSQGQTCHAFCTFCFRWPQFVGMPGLKFAAKEAGQLVDYLGRRPEVTDVLFTGGDPMVMRAQNLSAYIEPLLAAKLPHLRSIRIGTKSLSYWPYRYLTDSDADQVLALFERIQQAGLHLALMAHFNHPRELNTAAVRLAIRRIRNTGAQIRSQSPLLRHINDDADLWADLWRQQVNLGIIPYYMFVTRDTGAQRYFGVPLVRAWRIFRDGYNQVSGLARTVRGPIMSAHPGKVQIVGVAQAAGQKVMVLRMIQGRNAEWVQRPFFAAYDAKAMWLYDLKPAFGLQRFFFEQKPRVPRRYDAPRRPFPYEPAPLRWGGIA